MRVVPVHAYGIAATLRPKEIVDHIGAGPDDAVKVTKTHAVVRRGRESWMVIHDFGAIVFFDVPQADRDQVLARVIGRVGPEPHPPLLDDYLLEVKPGSVPQVSFDRAVVPDLDTPVLELVSLVLAQSVAMDYYEEDVGDMTGRVDQLANHLATRGRLAGRERLVLRFIGNTMVTRTQILTTLSLLDAPSITWEREDYDRLYRALRLTFEIEDRYRTLEHKLRMVQDNLALIVDLVQHRRAAILETMVVILILLELVLAVFERMRRH